MYQPSSKKQRRKSPARTQQQPTSFLARMKRLKRSEYKRLNNGHAEVLKGLSNNSSNVNASILAKNLPMSQNATTDVIRHGMYEYARVARLIDLAFDTTLHRGKVMGMGSNEGCQLMPLSTDGNDDNDDDDDFVSNSNIPPTFVLTLEIRAVSAGGLHSIALATNGTPYTWGNSSKGVLGTITDLREGNPLPVTGFHTTYQNSQENICEDGMIHQIAAGDAHSLFLSINGNVYQCGVYLDAESNDFSDDDSKKVVDGNTDKKNGIFGFNQKPVHVYQLPKKVITISASRDFNAAILEDHTLVTWGELFSFCVVLRLSTVLPTADIFC
jgi:Regulator of chromosome condensation (RCC1) repeat